VDWRFGAALFGEAPRASSLVTVLTFRLVAGGCGKGLAPPGVVTEFIRLIGELIALVRRVRVVTGATSLTPVMNSCLFASCGFIRRAGSQRRHRAMKSRKASSSHFKTWRSSFELGLLRLPLEDTVNRGLPIESKNNFFRLLFSIKCFSGGPNTSMMQASCSCSFSPGKMGYPVYNSASIHPTLHMSIGIP